MSIPLSTVVPGGLHAALTDRARRFDRVLLELSMSDAVTSGNLVEALREICAAATAALDVDRTNVWLFDHERRLIREAVAVAGDGPGLPPAELTVDDNPPYFAALEQERIISADDACGDPRTGRFAAKYFRPRGVAATLDAPIRLHGQLLGVICNEQTRTTRAWDGEEERFAASLGDLVALAIVADQRAAAQRAARATAHRYRVLVDGVRDLIFNVDGAGMITSLNPASEPLLGVKASEWVGRRFSDLLHPDDVPLGEELFLRSLTGHDVPYFEIRMRHATGRPVWFEFAVSIERENGRVRNVFGVGREITARKMVDTRRRALAEIGQALARHGDDLDAALDAVHQQIALALGCARVATVLADPVSGLHAKIVRCGGDAASFPPLDLVERVLWKGEVVVDHSRGGVDPATGGTIVLATVACPLRSPEGVLGAIVAQREGRLGFDGEQIDLLDRIAREVVLAVAATRRRNEATEDAAVSAALARVGEELIASVDMPLLLERLCRVTTEVLGSDVSYTFLRDDEQGAFLRTASFGDPPQVDEALRTVPIRDADTPGLVAALERARVLVLRPEDGVIPTPLWDVYGTRCTIAIALVHGIRLVGAQAASFRRADGTFGPRQVRIAHGIAQLASLAIANARLVGELESASRIKSDFVATISHELRTPLNVIIGYTDLLLCEDFGALADPQADILRRVLGSATELRHLIEATLDLSRLESGTVALRIEDVDLRTWLAEVRDETAPLCDRKPDLDVRWHAAVPDAPVRCDAVKLKVIVKNLIGNALKFTQQGWVTVALEVTDGTLTITVGDTGIGMTPEVRGVIFDAFRQGDPSLTRSYGGVGLGLYIVRRLVESLHGQITVESAPGAGSTFRVTVPLDPRVPAIGAEPAVGAEP